MNFLNNFNQDSIAFVCRASFYDYADNKTIVKKTEKPDNQKLFLLSKICDTDFFESIPKTFTISTKSTILHFNVEMLKETSPVISKFIQDNPNKNNYFINITDDENALAKIEKLYQGKTVAIKENEIPLIQRFTQIFQIKDFPNFLKPKSLSTNEIDSEGNAIYLSFYGMNQRFTQPIIQIYQKGLINFLSRDDYKVFKISTKKKEYRCSIFGVYTSNVIRQILEKDSTIDEFQYKFEDEENEFQLICDFFNCKKVDITSTNMDSLKEIAEDLQINCILHSIDNYINHYEKVSQKIDEKEKNIDEINQLFDLLFNIKNYGIEKVKRSIIETKWSKKEKYVEELGAFIIQSIKSDFNNQKEICELMIELNKESNEENKLNLLIPFIIDRLMTLYWPKRYPRRSSTNSDNTMIKRQEKINLTNKCVFSFIRILYKRGIIPKDELENRLKNYNLMNNALNAFFLPELVKIHPKYNFTDFYRINKRFVFKTIGSIILPSQMPNSSIQEGAQQGLYYFWPKYVSKYLPDKIDIYEKMLDNMEPDDDLTKSLRHDDIDTLQRIITKEEEISTVPYNFFDDFEEDISLINYAALYGSVKCFKYLLLNNNKVDESTFYFAVCGGNNEIIKIVDQQKSKTEQNEINRSNRYQNLEIDKSYISFWFNFGRNNIKFRGNVIRHDHEDPIIFDKYNDGNIQYEKYSNDNLHYFVNCCNINNIIAPTIVKNQNNLFDWVLQNDFVNKNKNGNDLKYIAILSASSGNAHSLIALIDNGYFITKKIISFAAENGFYTLTRLLLDLYDKKATNESKADDINDDDFFDYQSIVHFGNLSIFKLFLKYMNQSDFEKAFLHAIELNYVEIIHYIINNLNKFDFKIDNNNNNFINSALKLSIKSNQFNFLFENFKKLNPHICNLYLYSDLLKQSCLDSNLEVTKLITDLILKENPKFDFTEPFFKASTSKKSKNICQYFLEKKVFIDFLNSSYISDLGAIDWELFQKIIDHHIDQGNRSVLYKCIYKAILYTNKELIEFIFKEKPPKEMELVEAVRKGDIEIVEIILKYNSKPSFVNQIVFEGTALCMATTSSNLEIVKRLLSIPGIDPNLCNHSNMTPLAIAVNNLDLDMVNEILNYYENSDIKSNYSVIISVVSYLQELCSKLNKEISTNEWEIIKRFIKMKPQLFDLNYFQYDSHSLPTNSFLFIACYDNKIDIVELLLSIENVNVNIYDPKTFYTPLMISIEKNYLKLIKILLKCPKTNINLRTLYDESALTIAVRKNQNEIIDLILNDERFDPIESRLNCAFIYADTEISNRLYELEYLNVNQSYKIPQMNEINALEHSVKINDVDKIEMIINHPSFNIYESNVDKCIFIAIENNNVNVFRKLIELKDNNINIFNSVKESLISCASKNLSGDIIDEIFNNELFDTKTDQILYAFINSYSILKEENNNNNNLIQRPIRNFIGRINRFVFQNNYIYKTNQEVLNRELLSDKSTLIEIMNKLIDFDKDHEHLINFNKLLPNGKSFFTTICSDFPDISEVCNFLIEQGVDPNVADKNGVFPLEHAIIINSIGMVTSLVNSEKINYSQLYDGNSYLHLAARNKDSSILSFLLQKNLIDINSVNLKGETPLMEACKYKSIDNINLLFHKENIDYLHTNKNGKDALDILISLPNNEKKSVKSSKDKFYNTLISIINRMLDSNE